MTTVFDIEMGTGRLEIMNGGFEGMTYDLAAEDRSDAPGKRREQDLALWPVECVVDRGGGVW